MKTYNFLEVRRNYKYKNIPIPDDVDEYVIEQLKVAKIWGDPELEKMLDTAKKNAWYTDKTRAIILRDFHGIKLPLATFEFHCGMIKNFSYAQFFGDNCYFGINMKNLKVIFDRGVKNGQNRE